MSVPQRTARQELEDAKTKNLSASILDLFKTSRLRRITIAASVLWWVFLHVRVVTEKSFIPISNFYQPLLLTSFDMILASHYRLLSTNPLYCCFEEVFP